MTELSVIEEKANLIYADKLMQKTNSNLTDKPTMQEVVESLEKEKDCNIEKVAVSESDITGISLDKESMKLDFGASKEIKVSVLTSSGEPYTYYAVVEGKYYKMHFNNGAITIDRIESNIGQEGTTNSLNVSSSDETVATAITNNETNIVNVIAMNKEGTTTITVTYGKFTKTCSVEVTKESNWEELEKIAKAISKSGISSETKTATGKTEDGIDYSITVGDIFKVKYNGTIKRVRVLGFNHDELVSTSAYKGESNLKTAGISFEFLDFMTGTDYWAINGNENTSIGGWTGTTIRGKLESNKGNLSNNSYIKQVKKPYATDWNTDSLSSTPANDYLWLLSCAEIWGSSAATSIGCKSGYCKTIEGSQYKYYKDLAPKYNTGKTELVKKTAENGDLKYWWLRSPGGDVNRGFL